MLKLEPREAARIAIPDEMGFADLDEGLAGATITELQRWRHYTLDRRERAGRE